MIVAIIPARFGSKRIKNKNIKNFYSKPMISWTIKKLKESKIFDKIVVTSDSNKILKIAKKYKADILIKRSFALADDYTPTKPVIIDCLKKLKEYFYCEPKYVCCVYPCNPFLHVSDLRNSLKVIKKYDKSYVIPVAKYSHPVQRALKIKKNKLYFLNKKKYFFRTQDLEESYYDVGQFYWAKRKTWFDKKKTIENSSYIVLPSWRCVDIDNYDDWKRAEKLFKLF